MATPAVVGPDLSTDSIAHTSPLSNTTNTLPATTTSQSEEYKHKLAEINARACVQDPLNRLFQLEKTGPEVPITAELLYKATRGRIDTKTTAGSIIIESGNFAAVACWEPPEQSASSYSPATIDDLAHSRPIFADFLRQVTHARRTCLGDGQDYWLLSLMARDPERKDKGAVRAVMEPYIELARRQKMPLWLIAGNERARDVYEYFGFRVVSVNESCSADGSLKVLTWNMVCNWPPTE